MPGPKCRGATGYLAGNEPFLRLANDLRRPRSDKPATVHRTVRACMRRQRRLRHGLNVTEHPLPRLCPDIAFRMFGRAVYRFREIAHLAPAPGRGASLVVV